MRHNQAINHPKAEIVFWLLNISIICEHVDRLEFSKSFKFWVAGAT